MRDGVMLAAREARTLAVEARDTATDWLFNACLPLWSELGTDWNGGGFFETITPAGEALGEIRRTRVVGRQLYAFATAARLGWGGPHARLIDHGLAYFDAHCVGQGGRIVPQSAPGRAVQGPEFDLYDVAFALFGLAAVEQFRGNHARTTLARAIRDYARAGWAHPVAGFEEARPRTLPLKANPHMHMLEAALAWEPLDPGGEWDVLADEIGELALTRFIDADSGALREFFGANWEPMEGEAGRIVEPGHQFEWGWLLYRWGKRRMRADARAAAVRLIEGAERYGMRADGLALSELWDDFGVKDPVARLWQQTERAKAWVVMAEMAPTPEARDDALEQAAGAVQAFGRYTDFPIAGGAWERIAADGTILPEDARASSVYHLTCAIAELHGRLGE